VYLHDESLDPMARSGFLPLLGLSKKSEQGVSLGDYQDQKYKNVQNHQTTKYYINPRFGLAYGAAMTSLMAPSFTMLLQYSDRGLTVGAMGFVEAKLDRFEFFEKGNIVISSLIALEGDRESYVLKLKEIVDSNR
jgi:hypothetical protein